MNDLEEPLQGFTLWIHPRPGLTDSELKAQLRRLEDYCHRQDILWHGEQLRGLLWSHERSMTAQDQVSLINWLIDDPAVCSFSLSPLSDNLDGCALREEGYLDIQPTDLALIGLTLVHRLGRIDAPTYLHILGGFVRPALH